jgi:hypothetical protein
MNGKRRVLEVELDMLQAAASTQSEHGWVLQEHHRVARRRPSAVVAVARCFLQRLGVSWEPCSGVTAGRPSALQGDVKDRQR